jgi:hypothetical protein
MSESRHDPWGDLSWSDGEAADAGPGGAAGIGDHLAAKGNDEVSDEGSARGGRSVDATSEAQARASEAQGSASQAREAATCPWCATPAADGATRCSSCGAALAQRESIGDLVIPGLTAVDPALKDLDGRPIHLRGPSPTQGAASGIIVAAAAGGPIGLAIIGGVGALAAAEYLGAGDKGRASGSGPGHVGEASEAVLQALARLERGEDLPKASDATPRPELDSSEARSSEPHSRRLDSTAAAGAQSPDRRAAQEADHEEAVDGGT